MMKHIYDYMAEYASVNPDKIAVSDEFGAYTYAELNCRSSSVAAQLVSLGVKQGESVAVYVPYVKEIVLGTLAAIRCGGVYVPMDASYPEERLSFILQDSAASAVLTLRSVWEKAPLDFPYDRVIFLDGEFDDVHFVSPEIPMDAPAFILYTSGTTGRPKGVVLPHTMFVSLMDWTKVNEGTEITENTRVGIMTGLTFSGTTLILYSPLMYGGTTILVPEAARKDIDLLVAFLRDKKITHIFMASSLAATLAEHYDLSSINIFAGGEKLRNFRPISSGTRIFNIYGCTELGGTISTQISGNEEIIPNGYLAPDAEALIVDEKLNPVENGNVGELLVSTARMALRYLGLPEQTKEKWVELFGKRWFRTGDRVRLSSDGIYYVLGRTDNMVKLHGFRVETGEVEAQIGRAVSGTEHEVKNIAVVVRTVNGIDHLTCYYECFDELDTEHVIAEISKSLASYMVPDIWVRMDAMPRNPNGKIIRAQLPQPESCASKPGTVFNEAEARVVEAAASVLGIRSYISPDDGFAELGGSSLKAMELASALHTIGIRIGSSQILKLNTLRDIAAEAEIDYGMFWTDEENRLVRADFASRGEKIEKVLPITPEQDELLFEQILHPDNSSLRRVIMLQLDSLLGENELRTAFDTAAAEFEQLRAAFVFHKVTVFQQVITDRKIPLRITDLQEECIPELKKIYHTLKSKPCDLQRESHIQAVCARVSGKSFLFISDAMAKLNMPLKRKILARIMEVLGQFYPDDKSIAEWVNILRQDLSDFIRPDVSERAKSRPEKETLKRTVPTDDIHVYSEQPGKKKLVFVHTGNTGSEAYYSLAERIRGDFSFSVIEPFNLYHRSEASYGIKNIAARYVKFLKKAQPEGPYILGGWCYGGMVAHEMACQLQAAGDTVEHLILLDSHVTVDEEARKAAEVMHSGIEVSYFETSDLFADLRARGMLEALVENFRHVGHDMVTHVPSHYNGPCLYFKPDTVPAASTGGARNYWLKMMTDFSAGGYEDYCSQDRLSVISTPYEHDLMMNSESLDIIVPQIYRALQD